MPCSVEPGRHEQSLVDQLVAAGGRQRLQLGVQSTERQQWNAELGKQRAHILLAQEGALAHRKRDRLAVDLGLESHEIDGIADRNGDVVALRKVDVRQRKRDRKSDGLLALVEEL